MPRFYFHVERRGERIVDEEGSDLSDLEGVQDLALRSAADLAADDLKSGARNVEQFIAVEDATGREVLRVRVAAIVEIQRLQ